MIDKVSVREIAEECGATINEIMATAKDLSIIIKSPQSKLTYEDAEEIVNFFVTGKSSKFNSNFVSRLDIKDSSISRIEINIENLKSIKELNFKLKYEKGIYALVGENGAGKSSLLISIAKLIQPNIFQLELIGKGFETTNIKYIINEKEFNFIKNKQWKQNDTDKYHSIKIPGFFESSVLTGKRFKKIDYYIKNNLEITEDDVIIDAEQFIIDNMNYILLGEKPQKDKVLKFDSLKFVKTTRKRKKQNKTNKISYEEHKYEFYILEYNDIFVKEYFFSTGEYFLLSLLKYLNDFKNQNSEVNLVIIDEIELSLHPLAQLRLVQKLVEFSQQFNLAVIFATHSTHIYENIQPENIYYLRKENDSHQILNPIYPGFLTTKLYKHQYYDRVILVEDEMAKKYIECTIRDNSTMYNANRFYEIIPIGGWQNVLDTALNNINKHYYGNAKIFVLLDEDKKSEYAKMKFNKLNCYHIPILKNIESYIINLLIERNEELINYINTFIMPKTYTDLNVVINQPLTSEKIKGAFLGLIKGISNCIRGGDIMAKEKIVDYIYSKHKSTEDHNIFKKRLEKFLA